MSLNSQQFTTKRNYMVLTKGVHEIQTSSFNKDLETRIDELTSLVKKLTVGKTQSKRLCGICTSHEHLIDTSLTMQEGGNYDLPQAYASNVCNPQNNNQYRYNNTHDISTTRYHPN